MGILKHAVLPAFAMVHAASVLACRDLKGFSDMIMAPDPPTEADNKSIRQRHMSGCLGACHLAMLTLCGFGVFSKTSSSDTRQAIAIAETVLFGTAAWDAFRLGELKFGIPAGFSAFALIGTVVNFWEPGIFTKDHNA